MWMIKLLGDITWEKGGGGMTERTTKAIDLKVKFVSGHRSKMVSSKEREEKSHVNWRKVIFPWEENRHCSRQAIHGSRWSALSSHLAIIRGVKQIPNIKYYLVNVAKEQTAKRDRARERTICQSQRCLPPFPRKFSKFFPARAAFLPACSDKRGGHTRSYILLVDLQFCINEITLKSILTILLLPISFFSSQHIWRLL